MEPLFTRQPIQAMLTKWTTLVFVGVLKYFSSLTHTEPFHNSTRPEIIKSGKGDDLWQANKLKANLKGASSSLCCKALAPMRIGKPPANFDARRKRQFGNRNGQTNKPNELVSFLRFGSPKAPAT